MPMVTITPRELTPFFCPKTRKIRYEFSEPYLLKKKKKFVYGSNMCPPIKTLVTALSIAKSRLPPDQAQAYEKRLANPDKHIDYLSEMLPISRVDSKTPVSYGVQAYSPGNHDIDWKIAPPGERIILLEVKNRMNDLVELIDSGQIPSHEVSSLFRSTEKKFLPTNPDERLQGVWVYTEVRQEINELHEAFQKLDREKIHFIILGYHENDDETYILTRRPEDQDYLKEVFKIVHKNRFTFNRAIVQSAIEI